MNTSPEKLSALTGSGEQTLKPGPEAWALGLAGLLPFVLGAAGSLVFSF